MAKVNEKGLVAKKVGMTRMFDESGKVIPVTLLKVENQKITNVMTVEKNGYNAIQIGYAETKEKRLTKPDVSRLRKMSIENNFAKFTEFRVPEITDEMKAGTALTAEMFEGVDAVDVTGLTKGRGFQGSVRRWNTRIGRMTHGSRFHRRPGSLGQCTTPGRVYKNKKMPGHMGAEQRTIKNLRVVKVDTETNVIAVKGSVPGGTVGFLEVRPTNKK